MKKERMFGKFDIVHTCTSHTDKLWTDEIFVDPWDKNAVETGIKELQKAFHKASVNNPDITLWIEKPIAKETDNYGIVYKEWEPIYPAAALLNGNDPKHWSSNGILRIIRPVSYIRSMK